MTTASEGSKVFGAKVTCDECPWRRDVPVGRFPPERYQSLRVTVQQGFGRPLFACHKSTEGKDVACAGYLLSDDSRANFRVRLALIEGDFDPAAISARGPLFATYAEMEAANSGGEE